MVASLFQWLYRLHVFEKTTDSSTMLLYLYLRHGCSLNTQYFLRIGARECIVLGMQNFLPKCFLFHKIVLKLFYTALGNMNKTFLIYPKLKETVLSDPNLN